MDSNEAWNFEKYNICGQYYLSVSWLKVDFYFHILYQASVLLGMNKWLECDTGIPLWARAQVLCKLHLKYSDSNDQLDQKEVLTLSVIIPSH